MHLDYLGLKRAVLNRMPHADVRIPDAAAPLPFTFQTVDTPRDVIRMTQMLRCSDRVPVIPTPPQMFSI